MKYHETTMKWKIHSNVTFVKTFFQKTMLKTIMKQKYSYEFAICIPLFWFLMDFWITYMRLVFVLAKLAAPRVKTKAKCQNNKSRALKWGIVRLCTSNITGDMIKNIKVLIFEFSPFFLFWLVILPLFYKNAKIENLKFLYILLYLQNCLSYRNVLYLILKLLINSFDP